MDRRERFRRIKMLVMDVDGVLTDGQIFIGPGGEVFKAFNCQDGLGLAAATKAGLTTAIITGRESAMVVKRAAELSISIVRQGCKDKAAALEEIAQENKLTMEQIAYIGDDLNDLAAVHRAGLACAVANAALEVKDVAHFISTKTGGNGAVREIVELILKAQNKWENIINDYQFSQSEVRQ